MKSKKRATETPKGLNLSDFAEKVGVSRQAVSKAVKSGWLDSATTWVTRNGKRVPTITDLPRAVELWRARPGFRAPEPAASTGTKTEYERISADVERELGALGHDDRASNIAEANNQLADHSLVLAAIRKAKKAGRLDDELVKYGKWVRTARRSLTWAKIIARKRTLSDLDVDHLEAFITEALHMLLGDPELGAEDSTPGEAP